MRPIQPAGPYRDFVDGPSPDDYALTVIFGLRETSFQQILRHKLASTVAQYYGVVQDGLSHAKHLFKGLKRHLMDGDDKEADQNVLVYAWRPEIDYVWVGSQQDGRLLAKTPPAGLAFVVLIRLELEPITYPDVGSVAGSIEKWNWVKEDPLVAHAPFDFRERYETRLWSR